MQRIDIDMYCKWCYERNQIFILLRSVLTADVVPNAIYRGQGLGLLGANNPLGPGL